jgi:hypothetical protein
MKDADRLMYAHDLPVMYYFCALCRKYTKNFVNSEIAPFGVIFGNSKTVCK